METDGAHGGDIIDQQLLQQFSCLGTTDKDELVRQLQSLIGSHVSNTTAKFYLEMNNWNLQGAIGSYFDLFGSAKKLPSMTLLRSGLPDILTASPSTSVVVILTLMNNGDDEWPSGCYLQFTGGDVMGDKQRIVPPFGDKLLPTQSTSVVINLMSPSTPGIYKSEWRMVTPTGSYFGDTIWLIMSVLDPDAAELATQLSNLNTLGDPNSPHRADSSCLLNPFSSSQQPNSTFQD